MAARPGSEGSAAYGGVPLPRPAAVIMACTGHEDCVPDDVPAFAVASADDPIADPGSPARRTARLSTTGSPRNSACTGMPDTVSDPAPVRMPKAGSMPRRISGNSSGAGPPEGGRLLTPPESPDTHKFCTCLKLHFRTCRSLKIPAPFLHKFDPPRRFITLRLMRRKSA